MGTEKVSPGAVFGRLTVIDRTGEVRNTRPVWRCVCECGNIADVPSGSLLRGFTRSCGCLAAESRAKDRPHQDMVGRRFGRLVVLAKHHEKRGREYAWRCACDCGGDAVVRGGALRFGHTQSCGCLTREAVSEATSSRLDGLRFGRLVVLGRKGSRRGAALWQCLCDCGTETEALTGALASGNRVSCGCASIDKPGLRSERSRSLGAAHGSTRRSRKRGAGGIFTADQIDELYRKQRGRCAGPGCGDPLGDDFHRDHRVALSKGGTNDISNIELLCERCNLRKHAKDPVTWAQENGRLI